MWSVSEPNSFLISSLDLPADANLITLERYDSDLSGFVVKTGLGSESSCFTVSFLDSSVNSSKLNLKDFCFCKFATFEYNLQEKFLFIILFKII